MLICIDAGHGMSNRKMGVYDPGAVHSENGVRYEEASIALRYALSLRDILQLKGQKVFMTRDDDKDHAPVGQRAANAKKAGCGLLISLHLNDFDDDSANGVEVLYRNKDSLDLAKELQKELVKVTGFKDRDVKERDDLAVLKFGGKAALCELGFIANDKNREVLLNPQKRMEICQAIAKVAQKHL